MKIPYNWLKEYVTVRLSPERLAETLTMAGLSVESVRKVAGDTVLEIEITANRPDWLSMIGVAREMAALIGGKLEIPLIANHKSSVLKDRKVISVRVEDRNLCPRYTARVIRNIRVGESPAWLKARIETMGLRPVNNIVDITNFCLFETGEPMHAFDLDKISGGEVAVRRADSGEKIVVIEGAQKALDHSMLVIADSVKPIAIAGVMGGLNTEVTSSTKNILLEAAFFDPISVRRTARKLAISTESSYRFERGSDIDNVVYSSDRALGLILELTGGDPGEFIDIGETEHKKKSVDARFERVNKILGTALKPKAITGIVTSLGIKVRKSSKVKLTLEIPSFRNDLKDEIDIIEEISRVYGYDRMPLTIPNIVEQPTRMERDMVASGMIRSTLAALGANEIITYSLLSRKTVTSAGLSTDSLAEIQNPLTSEQEVMRPSLIPGMLSAMMWNMNRKTKDLKLFELGGICLKNSDGGYIEKRHLAIGITGEIFSSWAGGSRESSFFELKGIAEALFSRLGIRNASFKYAKDNSFSASECSHIEVGGKVVGVLGHVDRKVLNNFDIKESAYMLELDADTILKDVVLEKTFAELPKYPSIYRDISIIASRDILNADIVSSIKEAAGETLKNVQLIDRYLGKQIPEGKVSLTYRLEYQDPKRTLEEKDVLKSHSRVLRALEEKFGAKLR